DLALRIDAVGAGRQLALVPADALRLAELGIDLAGRIAGTARRVRRALVELATIRRVGEPVAAVGMGDDVVGRVEPLAVVLVGDDADRTVALVARHAARQVLAGELAVLEVEGVAVAVVGRGSEHAHMAVILDPAHLAVVGDVAPDQVTADRVPGRAFRPQRAGPQPLDRGVGLGKFVERRIDGEHVGIAEVGRQRTAWTEVARRLGDRGGGWRYLGAGWRWRRLRLHDRGCHHGGRPDDLENTTTCLLLRHGCSLPVASTTERRPADRGRQ